MDKYVSIDKEANLISIHFPSMTDFFSYKSAFKSGAFDDVVPEQNKELFEKYENLQNKDNKLGPDHIDNAHDVVELALRGDYVLFEQETKPRLEKLNLRDLKISSDKIVENKRKRTRGVFGDELDIHSVYQGNIDRAWSRTKTIKNNKDSQYVTLIVNIGDNWHVDCHHSYWRAAMLIKIMEYLQKTKKHTRIIAYDGSYNGAMSGKNLTTSIVIKKYNERLSFERLAAMTHLGFLRSFFFMAIVMHSGTMRKSLGYSEDLHSTRHDDKFMPLQFRNSIKHGIMQPIVIPAIKSEYQALQFINEFPKLYNKGK